MLGCLRFRLMPLGGRGAGEGLGCATVPCPGFVGHPRFDHVFLFLRFVFDVRFADFSR